MPKSKKPIPKPPLRPVQPAGKPQHLHTAGILILIFLGIFGMLGAAINILLSFVYLPFYDIVVGQLGRGYLLFSGIIGIIVACVWIIGSAGVIKEKPWSRKLLIATSIVQICIGIAVAVYSLLNPPEFINSITSSLPIAGMESVSSTFNSFYYGSIIFGLAFALVIQGIVLWYFTSADVKAYYKSIGEP